MEATRRDFVKLAVGVAAVADRLPLLGAQIGEGSSDRQDLSYRSRFYQVQMAPDRPSFLAFSVDSLGHNKLDGNLMLPLPTPSLRYHASRKDSTIEYRMAETDANPVWSFTFSESSIFIRSTASAERLADPVVLQFDGSGSHATLLGLVDDEGAIRLPGFLHFPARGTFRITSNANDAVAVYDASRDHGDNFIRVSLPPSTWTWHRQIEYSFEVTSVYPHSPGIDNDSLYDGYRRDFLSIFQLNPRRRALANNSASDATPITVFEFAMMAAPLPGLADGLTAFDLVRQTLERYIGGMTGYGMPGYMLPPHVAYDFLDVYPSLVMAASGYVQNTRDVAWSKRHYSMLQYWANKMIEFDRDGDGLMEYALSGNSGSWPIELKVRPSNWWDTIGFGYKDAYANALAYAAFQGMAALASGAGNEPDAELYRQRAEKIKAAYYRTFINPETGVLAGWKSADGKLHDYYFLFVNGMAVTYGLVTREQGNQIWDKLLAKMKQVGYHRFDLGLPGNLIPIRREDYVDLNPRYGGPKKADGSDGFQIFENGGATSCFAYYTIQALRVLGRDKEADAILVPMLKAFSEGGFQGRGPNGETYDWTDWNGNPNGYEGLLTDNYLTLLAAVPSGSHRG